MDSSGLRVLILGVNYSPEPTGIAPYTTRIAEGLRERGHAVRVVTAFPHYPQWEIHEGYEGFTRHEVMRGVPVTRLRHALPSGSTGLSRAWSEVTFGARLVTSPWGHADVVLCKSPALLSTAMAVTRGLWGLRRPAIGVVVQDLYSAGLSETAARQGIAREALRRLESRVLRRVDGVATIHERLRLNLIRELGLAPERTEVIRNWTHVPEVPAFDREAFRRQLGWSTDETVVLHAGAMGEKQNLSNVIEAARLAERELLKVRFVLLGDGAQRHALERHAVGLSRVQFLDPLPGDDYGRAMRSADVLLVNEKPGVAEMAVPSKLTSYFSTGVPVLAATESHSTTAEEVKASGAGVVVRPGDPGALVDMSARLGVDLSLARSLGQQGPAYCDSVLSEEAALDAYSAWVRRLYQIHNTR